MSIQLNHNLRKLIALFAIFSAGITYPVLGQNPVAGFTANTTSGCAPFTATFTDQSTGIPTNWNWEFSNGTLSNVQNPVVTFSTPGVYSVKLVVQNANGIGQLEKINYITVYPSPAPNFSADITLSCVPGLIHFTDLSTPAGSITSWDWDFGDGATSTQQNPTHSYNNIGFYTITLSVTTNSGCKQTLTKGSYIRVVGGVSTDFTYTLSSSCQGPFTANFQNQSSGPGNISYSWNFGNGQTSTAINPSTIFNSAGTYTIQLNSQSDLGCGGSIQKTITITGTTTDFIGPTNSCVNGPVSFKNNSSSSPLTSSWNFGDGTTAAQINPVKTFLTPGTYTVTLVNQYAECIDSIKKTITINDKPLVNFKANDSASCQVPFNVQFTDLTPAATSWLWDFGDGNTSALQNPTHQYNAFGNYTVTLTATTGSGCSNSFTQINFIKVQPVSISLNVPAGGCIPFTFTPQATIQTVDSIATYRWDLGEPGAIFNVKNPAPYTYTTAGNYNVSLTVITVSGCTKTITIPNAIRTGTTPLVDFLFNPADACAIQPITFTDNSVTTPGADVEWEWTFADGASSSLQNPSHIFVDTGLLNVTLTVSNNRCINFITKTVHVRPPVAGFRYTVDCIAKQITFIDTSLVDPTLAPLTYSWDFGNGTTSTQQNPPPVNYAPGTYSVTLTVTNGPCSYQIIKPVVMANESADFSIDKTLACKGAPFTLTAINSNAANIANYTWTINGAMISGGRSFTYSIPNTGKYDVTLSITDVNGCISTKTVTNYIMIYGPSAKFISATAGACLNKVTTFIDQSTPGGTITNWSFDFGDGTQKNFTVPPFTHTYSQLGGHDVSLKVTDNAGCTDSFALPASIIVTNPIVGFKADTFYCPVAPLQFVDTSVGVGLTYLWNFGNGTTSTARNPQNIYPLGDANYTVKLKITDISGCVDSVTKTNYIMIRSPKAAFDIKDTTTICPPLRTSFTFHGSDYKSYFWSFGDGGTSTLPNTSYFYGNYGTFIPKLYVLGPGGCIDSAMSTVTVHDPANMKINYGPVTTACNSLNVDFNLVVPAGYKFIFAFGDGTSDSSRRTSFSHFYSRPSFNTPVLTVYDSISGCQVSIAGNPVINVLGAIPLFGIDKKKFCDNGVVTFTDFTTKNEPIISTVWDFGDGGSSNVQSPTHNYTQPGTYIVRLNVTTQSNCSSSFSDTVFVFRTPDPIIVGRDTICLNAPELYSGTIAVADSITNWQWNFGNGQTSSQQNNSITYAASGSYTIQLTTSNKLGCSRVDTKIIYVAPPPTAAAVTDPIIIISGAGANLNMNYTGNIISYLWSPVINLDCIDCSVPFANPRTTTKYTVQVEDKYNCINRGGVTVQVICNEKNFFIPNTFSPNGDGSNDIFYPRGVGLFKIKSLRIFNRWGQVVFEKREFQANDPSSGWNGIYKGQKPIADVYVYQVEIYCNNDTVIKFAGNVALIL